MTTGNLEGLFYHSFIIIVCWAVAGCFAFQDQPETAPLAKSVLSLPKKAPPPHLHYQHVVFHCTPRLHKTAFASSPQTRGPSRALSGPFRPERALRARGLRPGLPRFWWLVKHQEPTFFLLPGRSIWVWPGLGVAQFSDAAPASPSSALGVGGLAPPS